jgi:hypothetical protein
LLFVIVVIAIALRAKDSPAFFTVAEEKLNCGCCACTSSFSARQATLIACCVVAVITLALAVASDCIPCGDDPARKLALAGAAFGLQLVGGATLYCCSSCGCSLCCVAVCAHGVCNRTMQATSAIGFSLLMWFLAASTFGFVVTFLSAELVNSRHERSSRDNYYYYMEVPCSFTLTFVPSGLTSLAGILSAASLLLHGHFVTLVPEALHNRYPPAPAPAEVQPPELVNVLWQPVVPPANPQPAELPGATLWVY